MVDHGTRFGHAFVTCDKSAESTLACLDAFCRQHGYYPKVIASDNGKEFRNKLIEDWCKGHGIEFVHGRAYHPQAQGLVILSLCAQCYRCCGESQLSN